MLVRSDKYIEEIIDMNILSHKDNPDIVAMLEDLKSELCLHSKDHDINGNLIKN